MTDASGNALARELYRVAQRRLWRWRVKSDIENALKFHELVSRLTFRAMDRSFPSFNKEDFETAYLNDGRNENLALLTLFALTEAMLRSSCDLHSPKIVPGIGSGIARFSELIKQVDPNQVLSRDWAFMLEAEQVRHNIIHASGFVSLSRKVKEVERIANRYRGEIVRKADRLFVTVPFVRRVSGATTSILDVVLPGSVDVDEHTEKFIEHQINEKREISVHELVLWIIRAPLFTDDPVSKFQEQPKGGGGN